MDEMLSAEVWSQGIGIVSLLDPRSNLLAVWGLDPGYSEQQCSSTSEGLFRNCQSSWSFFRFSPLFLTCAGSEAGAMAPQCRWDGALPPPVPVGAGDQAWAGPSSPGWEADSDTVVRNAAWWFTQLAFHSLGNTERSQGAHQHPADTVSPCISLPFQVSLCPYLRGVGEDLSE